VAEVFPELVVHDAEGKPETVRYHLLSTLLLNELQKEHAQNLGPDRQIQTMKIMLCAFLVVGTGLKVTRWRFG
jgi:hypothetical protein